LIEDVRDVPLPPAQMEQVLEAVSGAMARLLVSWGGYMNLEELDAAVSKLLDFGKSTTAVREALGSALTEFIDHIDDTLGEIDDPDDLDSFESELNGLMKRCGYSDSRVERDVDYRRQTLYERGPRRSRSQYGGFARAEEKPDVSDEEIRSMFRELSR
jgi:hypothetical protein